MFCFFASVSIWAQEPVRVLFYNTENLFDTIDNPDTRDEDFTPSGKLKYNDERYEQKLENLAQVINSAFEKSSPSIIGLCEVENKAVVQALIDRIEGQYQVVHFESPDFRGIDNAIAFATNHPWL